MGTSIFTDRQRDVVWGDGGNDPLSGLVKMPLAVSSWWSSTFETKIIITTEKSYGGDYSVTKGFFI